MGFYTLHFLAAQELLQYVGAFEDEKTEGVKNGAHPAEPVAYYLGSTNEANNKLRMKQLEQWFREYQLKRGHEITIFKAADEVARCLFLFN